MDTDWFMGALEQVGNTQADLARHLGLPPSAVSRMLRGGRQMKIQEAAQVAEFLGVAPEEVLRHAGNGEPPAVHELLRRGRPPRNAPPPFRQTGGSNDVIPIRRGTEEAPVGFTPRPPNLAAVRDAYAVYVENETMAPRYRPGWLLHVHPYKPPTSGRDVVVCTTDGTMLIQQLDGWNGDVLVLRQLNPEGARGVPRENLVACHLVVGVDQEG
jgi:transcriptional regulator with XRE-family HTH domain